MSIFDAFIKMWWLRFWLKFKSFSICKKESEDVPKIPRVVIEMLTKFILVYSVRRFVRKGLYLAALRSLLTLILISKAAVGSNRYTMVLLSTKMGSGLRESPLIKTEMEKREDQHIMRHT